nr:MAG TPA: hypothetical protein [Crassvirales sp.]
MMLLYISFYLKCTILISIFNSLFTLNNTS